MNKVVIIGIGIGVIIAAIAGIYAISTTDETPTEEAGVGFQDTVETTVEEVKTPTEQPAEEPGVGFEDSAVATVEEPEEEPQDEVEVTVEEDFGMGD